MTTILVIVMCLIVCSPLIISGVQAIRFVNREKKIEQWRREKKRKQTDYTL